METVRNPRRELSTWQQIAEYLGVTVRTGQNWERKHGLPIHRLRGERGRVWAISDELDAWRGNHVSAPLPPHRNFKLWFWALALVSLAVAVLTAGYILTVPGAPVSFEAAGSVLKAFDAHSREVWRYSLPALPTPVERSDGNDSHRHRGVFADLDGDGRPELLYTFLPNVEPAPGGTLLCIGQNGKLLWSYRPGRTVASTGGTDYSAAWDLAYVAALQKPRSDGGRIIVASHHFYSWPTKVAALNAAGKVVAEHWHPGWIMTGLLHDLDSDGREEILLGGINNSYELHRTEAALLVLDADFLTGQSAPAPGDTRQIAGLPLVPEAALVLFPKSPYPGVPGRTWFVQSILTAGPDIEVKVLAAPGTSGQMTGLHYRFDHHLECTGLTIDHSFDRYYAEGLPPLSSGADGSQQVLAALKNLLIPQNRFAELGN